MYLNAQDKNEFVDSEFWKSGPSFPLINIDLKC